MPGDSLGRSFGSASVAEGSTNRKKSTEKTGSISKRKTKKAAGLIKHLGTVDKRKGEASRTCRDTYYLTDHAVVGDMTWNPATLRWEGNESILRDFDSIPSPSSGSAPVSGPGGNGVGTVRPALITHYTGGLQTSSSRSSTSAHGPGNAHVASTIRIVGDMKFDPERMCWVSLGEEDPDPFADMADDEDDEGGFGSNTLTRANAKKLVSIGGGAGAVALGESAGSDWSSRLASESSAGGSVMSWEERTRIRLIDQTHALPLAGVSRRADEGAGLEPESQSQSLISAELWRECREAEERHKKEMKGWSGLGVRPGMSRDEIRDRERREEKRLWEIRYLAMRS